MVGKGRHLVLGIWSPDPVLSTVAPVGLAASVGTALVVDLVGTGKGRTLADLVEDGPRLGELSPARRGIAWLAGGRVGEEAALEIIGQLAARWPAVVVRVPGPRASLASVPVTPLFPGRLAPLPDAAIGVWQPVAGGSDPPGPGPILPRLGARLVRSLLAGQLPRRSRWLSAWRPIWEMPWA